MSIKEINNLDNDNIRIIKTLREIPDRIIVDSYKVIRKCVEYTNLTGISLYVEKGISIPEDWENKFKNIFIVGKEIFQSITGHNYNRGMVAIFEKPMFSNEVIPPFVILNGVTSPENVGSIIRTISAFNFKTLILDQKSASPFLRRVLRVSMGNFVFLNFVRINNLKEFITQYPGEIVATANCNDSISIHDWNPNKDGGFIIGSEGHGIDDNILTSCSKTIKIPINENVQHLNASVAAGIFASKYYLR